MQTLVHEEEKNALERKPHKLKDLNSEYCAETKHKEWTFDNESRETLDKRKNALHRVYEKKV